MSALRRFRLPAHRDLRSAPFPQQSGLARICPWGYYTDRFFFGFRIFFLQFPCLQAFFFSAFTTTARGEAKPKTRYLKELTRGSSTRNSNADSLTRNAPLIQLPVTLIIVYNTVKTHRPLALVLGETSFRNAGTFLKRETNPTVESNCCVMCYEVPYPRLQDTYDWICNVETGEFEFGCAGEHGS